MNDFGLDLAVIGNGRSAALLDPTARIVWWCYPRFDGDRRYHRRPYDLDSESAGVGRNWDYRYCWLRDAYFVVKALNRHGATQTMEDFISFILGIASAPWLHRGCSAAGKARCQSGAARLRARCGHLGIPRPQPGAHSFDGDMLGRLQPARRHRGASRHGRACRPLVQYRNRHAGAATRSGLEPEARRLRGRNWDRRSRRQRAAAAGDRPSGNARSPFVHTVEAIERELLSGHHIMRYASEDDFGLPETAFLVCRF